MTHVQTGISDTSFVQSFSRHRVVPRRLNRMLQDAAEEYPLVMTNIAIENGHLEWIFPLKMVISNSYVSLPEGMSYMFNIQSSQVVHVLCGVDKHR